jgi:hypothetical protein
MTNIKIWGLGELDYKDEYKNEDDFDLLDDETEEEFIGDDNDLELSLEELEDEELDDDDEW